MDCAGSIIGSSDKLSSHRMLDDAGCYWRFIWSENVWDSDDLSLAAQRRVDMKGYEKVWKKSRQVSIRCFCEIPVGPTSAYSVICQFVVWINSIRSVSKGVYRLELRCGKVILGVRSRDGFLRRLEIARECKNQSARRMLAAIWHMIWFSNV